MSAQSKFAEPGLDLEQYPIARPRQQALLLADEMARPRVSPARMLQDEVRRAFSPGPILCDRFSTRRAMKFIAPAWLGMWGVIALVGHLGHH
jgi:hypothetical protein